MQRLFTKNATGVAPDGRWYAGDVNALQDAVAAANDLTQTIALGTVQIGETGLQLLRYGAGEARLSGHFRTDGILRGLGGIVPGAFTTAQRDAIAAGSRPYGMTVLNSQTNQWEWNAGTDAAPSWKPLGVDPSGNLTFTGVTSQIAFTGENSANNIFLRARVAGDTQDRFQVYASGTLWWGGGGATAPDTAIFRTSAGRLAMQGVGTQDATFTIDANSGTNNAVLTFNGRNAGAVSQSLIYGLSGGGMQFRVLAGQAHAFYDGATAKATLDASGILAMLLGTSRINFSAQTGSNSFLTAQRSGDTQARFAMREDGQIEWGPGNAARDIILMRNGASVLQLNALLNLVRSVAGTVLQASVSGDTVQRFSVNTSGQHSWGPGNAAVDTLLSRSSSGTLDLGTSTAAGQLRVFGAAATSGIISGLVTTDTNQRITIQADGKILWGPGNAATDTTLARASAGKLQTGKLRFLEETSATPPASPQIGDRWTYPHASGAHWTFVYRSDLDATYPWHFVGGGSAWSSSSITTSAGQASGFYDIGNDLTPPFNGYYEGEAQVWGSAGGGGGYSAKFVLGGAEYGLGFGLGNAGQDGMVAPPTSVSVAQQIKVLVSHANGFSYSYAAYWKYRPWKIQA